MTVFRATGLEGWFSRSNLSRKAGTPVRSRLPRLTYANVMSSIAVFIALSGASYAAVKIPKNSVGEAQLKKNAVTGKKIKKSSITADKIKNGTITGADVNAATLGKVPSAANADQAGHAGSAGSADSVLTLSRRLAPTANESTQTVARQNATPVTLASNGQVSLEARCYVYGSTLYLETFAKTAVDGAITYGGSYSYYGSSGYLNSTTDVAQRYLNYAGASSNSYGYGSSSYPSGVLYGPDGNSLSWNLQLLAKQGNIPTYGNGAYGNGNVCIVAGSITKGAAS